jgi:hypothetical protein
MKVKAVTDESVEFMAVKELSRFISSDRIPTDPKLLLLHPPRLHSPASYSGRRVRAARRRDDAQDDDENPQKVTITLATSRQV